jgi:hypothetical protein
MKYSLSQAEACGIQNDKSHQNSLYKSYWTCIALASIFVVARIYTRLKIEARLWMDDYLMLATYAVFIAESILGLIMTKIGLGMHTWYISEQHLTTLQQVSGPEETNFDEIALIYSTLS